MRPRDDGRAGRSAAEGVIPDKLREDVATTRADATWISVLEADDGEAMGSVCIWTHEGDAPFSEIGWMVLPAFQGRLANRRSARSWIEPEPTAAGAWCTPSPR